MLEQIPHQQAGGLFRVLGAQTLGALQRALGL